MRRGEGRDERAAGRFLLVSHRAASSAAFQHLDNPGSLTVVSVGLDPRCAEGKLFSFAITSNREF